MKVMIRIEGWGKIAKFFGKHPDTIKRWFKQGKLPLKRNPANNRVVLYIDELQKSENTIKVP